MAGDLGELLAELLTVTEVGALQRRVDRLLDRPFFDRPPEHRTPIPWPPL